MAEIRCNRPRAIDCDYGWNAAADSYRDAVTAYVQIGELPAGATQTLRCDNGITIVAENGARFELKDANRDGHIDSVELSSKALLIEVPKKPGGNPFKVLTPQAIAAVRGTKWAVDVADTKTSVFVADGRVGVSRRTRGRAVVLGPGEGVDVEATGPLTVKQWGQPRIAALMARLGQ